jgi:hypothetical protein
MAHLYVLTNLSSSFCREATAVNATYPAEISVVGEHEWVEPNLVETEPPPLAPQAADDDPKDFDDAEALAASASRKTHSLRNRKRWLSTADGGEEDGGGGGTMMVYVIKILATADSLAALSTMLDAFLASRDCQKYDGDHADVAVGDCIWVLPGSPRVETPDALVGLTTTALEPDGTTTTVSADGRLVTVTAGPSGERSTTQVNSDGSVTCTNPNAGGGVVQITAQPVPTADGGTTTTLPDGRVITLSGDGKTITTAAPDGEVRTSTAHNDGHSETHVEHPDGTSVTTVFEATTEIVHSGLYGADTPTTTTTTTTTIRNKDGTKLQFDAPSRTSTVTKMDGSNTHHCITGSHYCWKDSENEADAVCSALVGANDLYTCECPDGYDQPVAHISHDSADKFLELRHACESPVKVSKVAVVFTWTFIGFLCLGTLLVSVFLATACRSRVKLAAQQATWHGMEAKKMSRPGGMVIVGNGVPLVPSLGGAKTHGLGAGTGTCTVPPMAGKMRLIAEL